MLGLLRVPQLAGYKNDNWGSAVSGTGTSLVAGTSNAESAWTQVFTALADDAFGISISVSTSNSSATIRNTLLDIGVDPAGGTSYTPVITDLQCGNVAAVNSADNGSIRYVFPLFITAGSTVAIRLAGVSASAPAIYTCIRLYGRQSQFLPIAQYVDTIGTPASSAGVSFTPGNAGWGSWVQLGTLSRPAWWWQLGVQVGGTTTTADYTMMELAFGDTSNKHQILKGVLSTATNESQGNVDNTCHLLDAISDVPSGAGIYVRGYCSAAPTTGYTALAYGAGG